ncbi:Diguanylate cyclase/phosphodiesterase with PAS/PAC and GAF sensor(S) [Beijerinckiaceae bacterium RH AL1]|nr:Diguanylate cyclase/phosphodiesterase with PAS/PAC and GAF sensor(S) [Beijerinckiaceae bacterium RH CH11]VVB49093.1 Diguanylate cyclase/phosphodiesterase with PAS/PAC and GAF sensor(S) [Beijerinckiaceae bacterium RH AL8]VVC56684.1 Diguanylate cyclase/phosphodiesterase with PAS/PAC and GAF sensor(S) [Beijerinckiaceae bacterium RH AL1]
MLDEDGDILERRRAGLAKRLLTEGSVRAAALHRIVTLAARLFDMPGAAVTIVGSDDLRFETSVGVDLTSVPREESFGGRTILSDEVLVVPDAREDERFRHFASVRQERIIFYAGAPMCSSDGLRIGAFCLIDTKPRRPLSPLEKQILKDCADLAMSEIESRRARMLNDILQGIARSVGAALICTNASGSIVYHNPAAEQLLGYGPDELIGKNVAVIVPQRFIAAHRSGMGRVAGGAPSKLSGKIFESVAIRKDGVEVPIDLSLAVWRSDSGLKFSATMRDITERKQREESLSRLAYYDPLTGLARSSGFLRKLTAQLEHGGVATAMLAEIDGLQSINDGLGHAIGDALIQSIAIRLVGIVPYGAKLARWNGQTFAVMLPEHDPIKARECASDLEVALAEPFEIDTHTLVVGPSIGAAMAPDHATSAEDLVAAADLALQAAKGSHGKRFRLFERSMQRASAARRALRDEIRKGLDAGEFELFYQPQVALATGAMIGAEALMRWRHPKRGLLTPGAFIPVMDDSMIALHAGWWTLDQACQQIARWRAASMPPLRISVNLFGAQLRYGGLRTVIADLIKTYGIRPGELELEVRESIANQDDDTVVALLRDLRDLGVGIALDDFGTGYASLSTLKRLPVSTIKIDVGFVHGLTARDAHDRAIVGAILSVGHELGFDIVAEGIETSEQATELTRMGCPSGQGYLYGRPVVASQLFAHQSWRMPQLAPVAGE